MLSQGGSSPSLTPFFIKSTYIWFCCSCKEGPMIWDLYAACLWCNLPRCLRCKTEMVESIGVGTRSRSHRRQFADLAIETDAKAGRLSQLDCSAIVIDDIHKSTLSKHDHKSQLAMFILQAGNPSSEQSCVDGAEYYWNCCHCASGPWLLNNVPACLHCGHPFNSEHCRVWN
jgi:hypothetical protein